MPQIEMNLDEVLVLEGVLESYLADLRMEISHTDRAAFRDRLKEKQLFLERLLERLIAEEELDAN
ncbi:MAG: hypothetical protein P1V51_11915 [Deltaproteobacteria bacterium]|nr:hypothetical protein [Deltaproteobacteria bacterium]